MMNERGEVFEIDLQKLLLTYLRKWWLILLTALFVGAGTLYVTVNFITPMYEADVTFYVNNVRSSQEVDIITNTNLATSQRLVNTYINIIGSDAVLEKVADASGMDIDAEGIREIMSAEQVDDTELFTVTITHEDPVEAAKLANAVAEVAPGEIGNIVEGSSTKIIDYAKIPLESASPSVIKNTVLGTLVGIVLVVMYLTLRFLMDVRIKDEEDLAMLFDLPILAQIPTFVPNGGSRKNGYGKNAYATAEKGGAN